MSTPQPSAPRRTTVSILWFPIFFAIALPVALGVALHQPQPRRFLRLWAWRAIAVAEPGYYEARERARAGTGGGMLLEDALRQYRPGA